MKKKQKSLLEVAIEELGEEEGKRMHAVISKQLKEYGERKNETNVQ